MSEPSTEIRLTKISLNLPSEVLNYLRSVSQREQVTLTETLRRAISMMKFIEDAQDEGKSILVRDPTTKETERVIFR